ASDSPLSARTPRIQPVLETGRKGFRSLDLVFGRKETRVARGGPDSAKFRHRQVGSVSEKPHYGPLEIPSDRTFRQADDTSPKTLLHRLRACRGGGRRPPSPAIARPQLRGIQTRIVVRPRSPHCW